MEKKKFFLYSGTVFLVVFIGHSLRVLFGWEVVVGGYEIPMWISWVVVALSGLLAYNAFIFAGYLARRKI